MQFTYKAKQGPVKIVSGIVEATTLDAAIGKVIQLGLTPLDVSPMLEVQDGVVKTKTKLLALGSGVVNLKDIVLFTCEVSDLVEASVPLLRALQIISHQTRYPKFKEMIEKMAILMKDGGSFSDGLLEFPRVFSSLYINMVKAGEISGQLDIVLKRLAEYLEKENETRTKIRSSLIYPTLILVVGICTIVVLLTFVFPRISVMFDDLNQKMPLPTLIVTYISEFLAHFWWLILMVIFFVVTAFKRYVSSDRGRVRFDTLQLKMLFWGNFIQTVEVGRLTRTLATLLETGVAMTTALGSVVGTMDNRALQEEIKKVVAEVTSGGSLKASLGRCVFFPEMALSMISVGEETGHLEKSLYKIADTLERQADDDSKRMITWLGPVVLIGVVAIVGFVVIAMLLPILTMNMTM